MERIIGLLKLMRPFEWSKPLFNILLATVLAVYLTTGSFSIGLEDIQLAAIAFVIVGPLLWGGLYTLNDWTDKEKDKLHTYKKGRPIASGLIDGKFALAFALILIALALIAGYFVNIFFLACLVAMLLNQFLYTLPPVRLKEKPILDFVSGSLVNPFFRFYSGWVLFIPAFNAPIEIIVFILALQFGGFTLYRLANKAHEKELNYNSSVALFGEKNIKIAANVSIAIGFVSFIYICVAGLLPLKMVWLAIGSLLFLPFYLPVLTNPQGADMKKIYSVLYIHLTLFVIGFLLLLLI